MNKILQRTLMAYRPLYLNGLLLDGRYRLPASRAPHDPTPPDRGTRSGRRVFLVALTGLGRHFFLRGASRADDPSRPLPLWTSRSSGWSKVRPHRLRCASPSLPATAPG